MPRFVPSRFPVTTRSPVAALFLVAALGLGLGLTGCAASDQSGVFHTPSAPATSGSDETTGTPGLPTPTAADGADADACLSGECEIEVSGTVEVDFDGEHGISVLTLNFTDGRLTAEADFDGGGVGNGTISGSGVVVLNNLSIQLVSHTPTAAIVALRVL